MTYVLIFVEHPCGKERQSCYNFCSVYVDVFVYVCLCASGFNPVCTASTVCLTQFHSQITATE